MSARHTNRLYQRLGKFISSPKFIIYCSYLINSGQQIKNQLLTQRIESLVMELPAAGRTTERYLGGWGCFPLKLCTILRSSLHLSHHRPDFDSTFFSLTNQDRRQRLALPQKASNAVVENLARSPGTVHWGSHIVLVEGLRYNFRKTGWSKKLFPSWPLKVWLPRSLCRLPVSGVGMARTIEATYKELCVPQRG